MDNKITKEIVSGILDRIVIMEEDKEFLSRPFTLESYYLTYNENILETVANLVDCILWRRNKLQHYFDKYCEDCHSTIQLNNDLYNIPTIYINSYHSTDDVRHLTYNAAFIVEQLLKNKKTKTYNIVIDFYNAKSDHYLDIGGIKNLVEVFKKYYPYRINKAIFINVSKISCNLINITKPLLSEYMKDRVYPITDINAELCNIFNSNTIQFFNNVKNNLDKTPKELARELSILQEN